MVILDMDHPDIEEFIAWKKIEEDKARILIEHGGFAADFNGEAYATVSGQNSNNSVRASKEFLHAVVDDLDWDLTNRTDGKVRKTLKARDLWRQIADAAWACADPGMQYHSTIQEWHTSPAGGEIRATNPCSEYVFLDDTACNLASINLVRFTDAETGVFDIEAYQHAIRIWTIVLEISVTMAHFPSKAIAQGSFDYRTLGLGFANLGSLLMRSGIPYDSDLGRAIAGALTSILTGESYAASAEMAEVRGAFPRFEENRESMLRVIRNHRRAAYDKADYEDISTYIMGINTDICPPDLLGAAQGAWDKALDLGETHGFRNAQATVLAPTGCLVGGSLVATDRGLVRLHSLGDLEGDQWQDLGIDVSTDEGAKEATQFYINGVEPVVTVDTTRGYRIQGTPQHRVKGVDAETGEWVWRRFGDIAIDDLVPLQMNQLVGTPNTVTLPPLGEMHWTGDFTTTVPREMSAELAEFVGYFMGDGSLHAKGLRFCVAAEDFDVIERLRSLGKQMFSLEAHVTDQTGYAEVAFHSVPLTVWWESSGFAKFAPHENHVGKGYTPHIPDSVLHSNDLEVYRAFIRGLFEADGYAHSGGYASWSTVSADFSRDVQSLLLALGYPTTRRFNTPEWGSRDVAELRLLNLTHSARWAAEIGFISDRKQAGLASLDHPQAARKDHIPVPRGLIEQLTNKDDALRNTLLPSLRRIGLVSRRSAIELLDRTGDERLRHLLGFFYDRVSSAELGEEQWTYDLSVPENVTYVANGFVSHNTIGLLMDCDTTGVEPDFALVKFKKLAGGGYFKIANQSIAPSLSRLDYTPDQVDDILAYVIGTSSLEGAPHVNAESLAAKGFTAEDLATIEQSLPATFDLRFAFNVFSFGTETLQRLGFTEDEYTSLDFDLLAALGFSKDEITTANNHICGRQTIEGAPHLLDEHLPVFDCANRNGKYGQRFIHHTGHIKMMAAAQPFISGAISKCVTGETLLTTADGLIRIGSLHQSERPDSFRDEVIEVASLDGPQKTDAFYYGGMRPVREVTLGNGHRVTGTLNHRLLTAADGDLVWRRLDEIGEGEYVANQYSSDMWSAIPARFDDFTPSRRYGSQKSVRIPKEMTDELAFLLGAYVAEGNITRANWTIHITNADEGVLERISAAWQSLFEVAAPIRRPEDRCWSVEVSSKEIVEFLDYLGCGDTSYDKRIPDAVLRSPRSTVLEFLSGLFLDGYTTIATAPKMAICVASSALMDDLQAVLTNLGVLHSRVEKYNKDYERTYYEVYAAGSEAQRLARLVPFAEEDKAARASELLALEFHPNRNTADVIPGLAPHDLYEMIPAGKSGRNGYGERSRFSFLGDPRTRHVTWRTLARVAMLPEVELPEWLHRIITDDLHFSPVTAVGDAGVREVFDVSVPETHAFVGNGIVNHNTINMPNEVNVDEVEEAYMMSWELGIKAMALYRDGSKASQPLSASSDDAVSEELPEEVADALIQETMAAWGQIPAGTSPTAAYSNMPRPRFLLPPRRQGWTQEARIGGHKVFLRAGEYDDGTLGEIFIDLAKEGATLRGVLASFAIAVSKGLQYGVPLEEFVDTFTFQTFEPRGMVEGHPNIKMANSIIDYIFRSLGMEYLNRDELVQIPPDRSGSDLAEPPKGLAAEAGQQLELTEAAKEADITAQASAAAFTDAGAAVSSNGNGSTPSTAVGSISSPASEASVGGGAVSEKATAEGASALATAPNTAMGEMMGDAPVCSSCGHMTVRNGSCYVCLTCGDTTGCS